MNIRLERKEEQYVVENLIREAFWNVYQPGCHEHYLMHVLRDDKDFVSELNYVMELEDEIIGQAMYMKAQINRDEGDALPVLTLGPICIAPEYEKQGYGKQLLDYTLEKAKSLGYGAVFLEGNIDFYGKSGFTYAAPYGIRYPGVPEGVETSFFLACELVDGYLNNAKGEYAPSKAYEIDPKDVEEFDKTFPPKQKLKLPGQIFG